ncbi:unnamed protein product [Closterium sp. NIES-53]
MLPLLLPRLPHLCPLRPLYRPLQHPPPLFSPTSPLCLSFLPPHPSPLHLLQLPAGCWLLPSDRAPTSFSHSAPSPSSSPLSLYSPHYLTSSSSLLSPSAAAGIDIVSSLFFVHTFHPPQYFPLRCLAADYSAVIPPPLNSPASGAAADSFVVIPPALLSPFSGVALDYSAVTLLPLKSPPSGAAADYSVVIPPPLKSPPNG